MAGVESAGRGSIVVGLPPGSQHEIGALSFADSYLSVAAYQLEAALP